MAGAKIALSSTSGELKTDSYDNAKVNSPLTSSQAGFSSMVSEVDSGSVLGSRTTLEVEVTDDYRTRVGIDTMLFNLSFEGTNIARDRIQQNDTTMTAAQASGFLSINSANATASGNACNIRTYRTFPLMGSYVTRADFWVREGNPTATNAVSEWGFGYATGVSSPTDGVFFRRLAGGQLRAVVSFGGSETVADITTTAITNRDGTGTYDAAETQSYLIYAHNNVCRFWINNKMVAVILTPSTQGGPAQSSGQPLFARVYNSGVASAGRRVEIGFMSATLCDMHSSKPYGHIMSGLGGGAYQIQPGTASGPTVTRGASATAGWPASTQARATGTWTATTAPAVNSLGGQWVSPAISTLTTEADYPVFAYLNPAGTSTLPGKTLYITGVKWGKTIANAAASTNTINLQYLVAVGGTAANTSTAEAAAALSPRGIILDTIPFKATAVIGDYVEGGDMSFSDAPLVVNPGCYLMFVVRPFGTVASNTLTVLGSIAFSGYYE